MTTRQEFFKLCLDNGSKIRSYIKTCDAYLKVVDEIGDYIKVTKETSRTTVDSEIYEYMLGKGISKDRLYKESCPTIKDIKNFLKEKKYISKDKDADGFLQKMGYTEKKPKLTLTKIKL